MKQEQLLEMSRRAVERRLQDNENPVPYPRNIFEARDFGIDFDDKYDNPDPGDERL
jgi:hypothetical protein